MTKKQMARAIANSGFDTRPEDIASTYRWQMSRPIADVRESYQRSVAIRDIPQSEINTHCQLSGLPKPR